LRVRLGAVGENSEPESAVVVEPSGEEAAGAFGAEPGQLLRYSSWVDSSGATADHMSQPATGV
jgi:hypothetical protein